jgi:hypothetical protein
MRFGKIAEASVRDKMRSCFLITARVRSTAPDSIKRFRDPIAIEILQRVAIRLRAEGFLVTEPRPGKACDGGFDVRFPKFSVTAILLAKRSAAAAHCIVLTWCSRPFWRRLSPQAVSEGWIRVCSAIEAALNSDVAALELESVQRFTENEGESVWEAIGAEVPQNQK